MDKEVEERPLTSLSQTKFPFLSSEPQQVTGKGKAIQLEALRVPGVWGSQISRQSATHEGGRVASPTHQPPLPQEISLVLISVTGWIGPRTIVRLEGLCQWKDNIRNLTHDLPVCSAVPKPICATVCPWAQKLNFLISIIPDDESRKISRNIVCF